MTRYTGNLAVKLRKRFPAGDILSLNRFTSRQNNAANPNGEGDDGTRDRRRRNDATRVDTTKIVDSSRKRD